VQIIVIILIMLFAMPADMDARRRRRSTPPAVEKSVEAATKAEQPKKSAVVLDAEMEKKLQTIRQDLQIQVKQKRIDDIEKTINAIPSPFLSKDEQRMKQIFVDIKKVESDVAENASQFFKESDLDDATQKALNRIYKEARLALLMDDKAIAQDLFVHMLYLHRRNAKAKKILEHFYGLSTGAYKVENMASKYWKLSSVHFYGGNYEDVINDLTIYGLIDPDNPETYERMGSAYYMLGKNDKAVETWTAALFLDPDNATLEQAISKAKKFEQEQKQDEKRRREIRRSARTQNVIPDSDAQLLGVFPTRSKAYNYAQKLKEQGITAYVQELENGKWSVKAAKSDMKN